jgi:catechol 2,3-dioxygenase-like lactoylglutathione lyase family enzyme
MIDHLDHLVLTTANEAARVDFYTRVLGMHLESFIGGAPPVERRAVKFGHQKINLHVKGREFEPKAHLPEAEEFEASLDYRALSKALSQFEKAQQAARAAPAFP